MNSASTTTNESVENEANNNAGATRPTTTSATNNTSSISNIRVGSMVEVARRMWPGINQPGGTGRVLCIHTVPNENIEEVGTASTSEVIIAVDVHYIVEGRKEKRIPIQYVSHSPEYEDEEEVYSEIVRGGRRRLRDRSQLLGRCKQCGSLRADCGACDWMMEDSHNTKELSNSGKATAASATNDSSSDSNNPNNTNIGHSSSSSRSTDDDDEDLLTRRLPMLLSSSNNSTYLHQFLNDQIFDKKKKKKNKSPKRSRRNHTDKSILETLDGARDDNVTSHAIGSPPLENMHPIVDTQMSASSSSKESEDDEEEDIALPKTRRIKRTAINAILSEEEATLTPNSNGENEDNCSLASAELPTDKSQTALVAITYQEPDPLSQLSLYKEYYERGGPEDQLFIQPEEEDDEEGEGIALPKDVLDRTADILDDNLPNFFDELASKVQHILIPRFQIQLVVLQKKSNEELQQQQLVIRTLYQQICQDLIRDGVDQLTTCLRKMFIHRRKKSQKLSYQEKKQLRLLNERRDLTLELIDQKVQSICHDLRKLMISSTTTQKDEEEEDKREEEEEEEEEERILGETSSSGSSDAYSNFQQHHNDSATTNNRLLPDRFDPHSYAYLKRKRRKKTTAISKKKDLNRDHRDEKRLKARYDFFENEENNEVSNNNGRSSNKRRMTTTSVQNNQNKPSHLQPRLTTQPVSTKQKFARQGTTTRAQEDHPCHSNSNYDKDSSEEKNAHKSKTFHRRPLFSTSVNSTFIKRRQQHNTFGNTELSLQNRHDNVPSGHILSVESVVKRSVIPVQSSVDHLYGHLRAKINEGGIDVVDFDDAPPSSFSDDVVTSPLRGNTPAINNSSSLLPDNSYSIDNVLHMIHKYLSNSSRSNHDWMEQEKNLKCILSCIQSQLQHSVSLLEWMYTNENDDRFIQLLKSTFEIIVCTDPQLLAQLQDDAICQLFLSPKFGEVILLQIIDVIYSQRLPKVWLCYYFDNGTKTYLPSPVNKVTESSWENIVQLIALMNKKSPILEVACNILVKHFKCQQWRKTMAAPHIYFVSSVDSISCRNFFKSGELINEGSKRIGTFKKNLPRCEIDALWAILSTFALQPPFPPKTLLRWQILDLCLFGSNASVFSSMNSELELVDSSVKMKMSLPPYPIDPLQLSVGCKEFQFVIDLLNSRALLPFPQNDTFLIKLLKASIHLHVNSVSFDRLLRSNYCKSTHLIDDDTSNIRMLWESTDLLYKNNSGERLKQIGCRLLQEAIEPCTNEKSEVSNAGQNDTDAFEPVEFGHILSVSPVSRIVRSGCSLLAVWTKQLILAADSNRSLILKKCVEELVHRLVTEALLLEESYRREINKEKEDKVEDSLNFALLFPEEFNDSSVAAAVCLREAACFLLLTPLCMIANLKHNDVASGVNVQSYFRIHCGQMRVALWNAIAMDSWMQDMQKSVFLGKSRIKNVYSGPLPVLDFSSKVMSGFALCLLQDSYSPFVDHSDEMSLAYVASCIVTSIEGTCDLLEPLIVQEDKECFSGSQKHTGDFFYSPNARQCVKVLSRSCSLLCLIFTSARDNDFAKCISSSQRARNISVLGDSSMSIAASLVKRILSLLVASRSLGPEGDICFRSALALMRSTIALKACNGNHSSERPSNVECDNGGSLSFEAFNQISDDEFLNIDLDNLTTKTSTEKEAYQQPTLFHLQEFAANSLHLESVARQRREPTGVTTIDNLWFFLEYSLIISKPSLRFCIAQKTESLILPPWSDGRALCERQSGGICSLLAALGTIRKHESGDSLQELYKGFFLFDETDRLRFNFNDFTYFKHLRHCLYAEVCRLSLMSETCKSIIRHGVYDFLTTFLDATVDASCLYEFPTCCLDIMEEVGGEKSRKKERARLRRLREGMRNSASDYPDLDAFGFKIPNDAAFDAPGPLYLCRNLWTFGRNLGIAISQNIPGALGEGLDEKELAEVSGILSDSKEEFILLISELLSEVKQPSLESECIKRLTKLTRILACFALNPMKSTLDCVSAIVTSIIEQLNYVTEGYCYQMMTRNDPYSLAKFHILQENYTELAVAVISSILSCLRPQDLVENLNVLAFFRDSIVSPSLRGGSIELNKLMRQALQSPPFPCERSSSRFPHVPFSLCQPLEKDTSLNVAGLSNLSKALGFACRRRLREVVLHTALGSFNGKCSILHIFNELIEIATNSSISFPIDESHQQFAFRFGHSLRSPNLISESGEPILRKTILSHVIDRCLFLIKFSNEKNDSLNRQMKVLRWQTIQNFLIPKFSIKSAERRKLVLGVFSGLFHNDNSEVNTTDDGSSVLLLRDSVGDSLACLYDHICPLIKAIILCVKEALGSSYIDWALVELLFQLSTKIILTKTQDENSYKERGIRISLLSWSHRTFALQDCNVYWQHAKYIFHFSKWMHALANLLINTDSREALHRFAFFMKDSSWIIERKNYKKPVSLTSLLTTLLDIESDEQTLFADVNNSSTRTVVNVYAKPAVEMENTTIEICPITPTAVGAANELLVATSFYFS